jgi:hypothetical protein
MLRFSLTALAAFVGTASLIVYVDAAARLA